MEKRIKVYALILLALCLAVPSVNADLIVWDNIISNDIIGYDSMNQTVNYGDTVNLNVFEGGNFICTQSVYNQLTSVTTSSYTVTVYRIIVVGREQLIQVSFTVDCVGGPDPTPSPVMPYISFSAYHTDPNGAYIDYNVQCVPDLNEYGLPIFYRAITFSEIDSSYGLRSAETLIQVRVFAGNPAYVYSAGISEDSAGNVLIYPFVSTMLPAPVASSSVLDNSTVREELQNIPNPVKTSTGLVSGSWQALAIKKNVSSINTPFSEIISNNYHYFKFPEMTSPEIIKASLLNGTANITLPLYDAVDGFTSLALLLPNYVSGVLIGLINPIAETFETVKDVILTTSDYVQDAMQALYAILPLIYLFIPDFIWWGFTIYLSYLVFAWTLTLLFGYDVISTFYVDPFVSWVKSRRGGE